MKLVLGTAQFGLDYGVTNARGKVARPDASEILRTLAGAGVTMLDTAAAYGDAEATIGAMPETTAFDIVTKIAAAIPADVDRAIEVSLSRLGRSAVHGVLLHDTLPLLSAGGDALWRALERAKAARLASRIGVSVYAPDELNRIAGRYPLDIVQAPVSVVDRRFLASGGLAELRARGAEIHARSVLLQGLLTLTPDVLPKRFATLRPALDAFHRSAVHAGLSPLAAAVGFVAGRAEIDRVVVGVTSVGEARQLTNVGSATFTGDGVPHAPHDELPVDPRRWEIAA